MSLAVALEGMTRVGHELFVLRQMLCLYSLVHLPGYKIRNEPALSLIHI